MLTNRFTLYVLLLISIGTYCLSLLLSAFDTNVTYLIETRMHEPSRTYLGYQVLFLGWASMFFGVFAWLANIGYFISLFFIYEGNKYSLHVSAVTFVIALTSLTKPTIEKGENGYDFYISNFNIAFYLWLSAIAISFLASIIQRSKQINESS
jgi:hypothetical protein